MKSNQRIEITVGPGGAITIDAVGYTGNSCEEATRFLEEELGTIANKRRTRDYYRKNKNRNSNQESQTT